MPAKGVVQVKDLLQQLAELEEAVGSLYGIRAAEEELERSWFQTPLNPEPTAKEPKTPTSTQGREGGQ